MTRGTKLVGFLVVVALVGAGTVWFRNDGTKDERPSTEETAPAPKKNDPAPSGPNAYLKEACEIPARWAELIHRGWTPGEVRDYDLSIVPTRPNYMGTFVDTSHSGPYGFLQRVPMLLYGPGFIKPLGRVDLDREVTVADMAPTAAELMDFAFPQRQGRVIEEVLEDTPETPKLILTIVIDGGGWNVLEEHPDAWPNLASLIEAGANVDNASAGSSPSITPAIHTNIGTGSFPRQHGVTAIAVREDNGHIAGAFTPKDNETGVGVVNPTINLRQETLADLWDLSVDNAAQIALVAPGNYQLGMLGHGAALPGADADIVTSLAKATGEWTTNPEYFTAPRYVNTSVEGPEDDLRAVDIADGKTDDKWRGHEMGPIESTPAFAPWQNRIVQALVQREGFGDDDITDIFQLNYKSPDSLGHIYNMISPEENDVLRSVDQALGEMISFLDAEVGQDEYVVMLTADHGQTPLEIGGWPISRAEIKEDIDERFGIDSAAGELPLLEQTSAAAFFMRRDLAKAKGITPEQVATFLTHYTIGDNVDEGTEVPAGYEDRTDERIFDAVIPGRRIDEVVDCTGASPS